MEKNEKKREEGICKRICKKLEIAPDIPPGASAVEILGRDEMSVHGCKKILEYSPEEIRLALPFGTLSVKGRELVCISYYFNSIGIEGTISSVSFEE